MNISYSFFITVFIMDVFDFKEKQKGLQNLSIENLQKDINYRIQIYRGYFKFSESSFESLIELYDPDILFEFVANFIKCSQRKHSMRYYLNIIAWCTAHSKSCASAQNVYVCLPNQTFKLSFAIHFDNERWQNIIIRIFHNQQFPLLVIPTLKKLCLQHFLGRKTNVYELRHFIYEKTEDYIQPFIQTHLTSPFLTGIQPSDFSDYCTARIYFNDVHQVCIIKVKRIRMEHILNDVENENEVEVAMYRYMDISNLISIPYEIEKKEIHPIRDYDYQHWTREELGYWKRNGFIQFSGGFSSDHIQFTGWLEMTHFISEFQKHGIQWDIDQYTGDSIELNLNGLAINSIDTTARIFFDDVHQKCIIRAKEKDPNEKYRINSFDVSGFDYSDVSKLILSSQVAIYSQLDDFQKYMKFTDLSTWRRDGLIEFTCYFYRGNQCEHEKQKCVGNVDMQSFQERFLSHYRPNKRKLDNML
jgi:hypothetical protein